MSRIPLAFRVYDKARVRETMSLWRHMLKYYAIVVVATVIFIWWKW